MPNTMYENRQKAHYEAIHDDYEAHYYDPTSMVYRERFILGPLFDGVDLNGQKVADLACGSGHNSVYLKTRFPDICLHGFDISETACIDYRTNVGAEASIADLTRPMGTVELFDAAVVIGGLHHLVDDLDAAFSNIAALLKPGGYLFMMEPSEDFLLSWVRRIWYRQDRWFEADTEAALKHDEIFALARPHFKDAEVAYFGGPAFYLILNSLILRIPISIKPILARILHPLEAVYGMIPWKGAHAAFRAVWCRTSRAARG